MLLRSRPGRRPAVVLLAVLTVIVVLTLAAYRYNDWMLAEYRAADSSIRAGQARALAASGVHYAAALLADPSGEALGGNPWDNAGAFEGVAVPSSDPNARPGRFNVLSLPSPDNSGSSAQRFGVTDEAGKLNVNYLLRYDGGKGEVGKKMLMALPNMTEDVANAILDWIDEDSTPRTGGAENDVYSTQMPPYRAKNGPLDSIEELLLVRGVSPQLLFGSDRNRNGLLDSDEGEGPHDAGWSAYLTVYSREVNVDGEGKPRIFLNESDLTALKEQLTTALDEEMATFIIACRLYGVSAGTQRNSSSRSSSSSTGDASAAQAKIAEDLAKGTGGKSKVKNLWDLVEGQVSITLPTPPGQQGGGSGGGRSRGRGPGGRSPGGQSNQQRTYLLRSPLSDPGRRTEMLPKLLDLCTREQKAELLPRINVNTAPQAVLAALKEAAGLTDGDVSSIVSGRPALSGSDTPDAVHRTPAWLLTDINLSVDKLKKLDKYITARAQVYRFQVLGTFDRGGPTARVEAVVDTNQGRPRIVYFRDLSELGRGFDPAAGR